MISVILTIHLMLVLALIGVVLLQKSEGGGFVSTSSGFLTSRGTANVLTRATALLAAGFFITSVALSILAGRTNGPISLIGGTPAHQTQAPAAPFAPLTTGGGGLFKQLGGKSAPTANKAQAPAPTPAPSAPQVPVSK